MSDTPKPIVESPPSVEAIEDSELKDGRNEMDVHDRENAVGYSEYLEARDIDFSDAEVRPRLIQCATVSVNTITITGQEAPMETRSRYSPYVPRHPSASIHG